MADREIKSGNEVENHPTLVLMLRDYSKNLRQDTQLVVYLKLGLVVLFFWSGKANQVSGRVHDSLDRRVFFVGMA